MFSRSRRVAPGLRNLKIVLSELYQLLDSPALGIYYSLIYCRPSVLPHPRPPVHQPLTLSNHLPSPGTSDFL